MGRRGGKSATRSKSSPAAASDADERAAEREPEGIVSLDYLKSECVRAMDSLHEGSHTKALRIMEELCAKHENSPYAAFTHRFHGTVCLKVAEIIDNPNKKQRNLKNAIEAARKATSNSPNSIEFAHFYANLMYYLANEENEYEDVIQECERILAIENPVDPNKEFLHEIKESTADGRIEHLQNDLRNLIQMSSLASISCHVKQLGNVYGKSWRVHEDSIELRPVQATRPDEIKNSTKTHEERRKEIEAQVAAARLMMQKPELAQSQNGGDKDSDPSAGLGQTGNARKSASSPERRNWVKSYWDSMTRDMKKELFRIRILDLKTHNSSLKDSSASEVLSEALLFSKVNKSWKFWACCHCVEKFADSELYIQHVKTKHIGILSPELESVLPLNVKNEWANMFFDCSWKPLDINAVAKFLEKLPKPQEQSSEMDLSENGFSDDEQDLEWSDFYDSRDTKPCFVNDPESAKLLEKIRSAFQALLRNKYLASSHMSKVMNFSVEELQGVDHGSLLLKYNIDQTPLCICFLGSQGLIKVLKFLLELCQSCGISRYSESDNAIEDENIVTQVTDDAMEKIVFSEDGSCLLFDEHFLPHGQLYDVVTNDRIAAVSSNIPYDNKVSLDPDTFFSWIFTGPSSREQLDCWPQSREEKAQQSREILALLEKEFHDLLDLCERKCDLESGEGDDWMAKDSCIEVAIQGQNEHNSVEVSKIDARILRVLSGMKQLELKLEAISGNDYRMVLVPLVKSYLLAYLEDLAEKAAMEKSDDAAAQE